MQKKHLLLSALAFVLFLSCTFYITFPLPLHITTYATGLGDELLIAWIQNWNIHAFFSGTYIFDTNIFFPLHNTLAYSDTFFTSSVLSIISLFLFHEPIVVVNTTFLLGILLTGYFTYLFIYYLTRNFYSAMLSGLIIIFSPTFLDKRTHLQILSVEWIPITMLFFILFIRSTKTKYLLVSLIFFLLQTYNSFLPGYFIVIAYIVIFMVCTWKEKKLLKKLLTLKNILAVVIALLFLIPLVIPYYHVSNELNAKRDIRDAIHFALQPEDLFFPNELTRLQQPLLLLQNISSHPKNAEYKYGYLGLEFSLLTLFAVFYFVKKKKWSDPLFLSFLIIGITGLVLSFGPALHINRVTIHKPFPIILPYTLFYYIAPGFQGFRNSARWEILFILFMSFSIGLIYAKMYSKITRKSTIIFFVLVAGILLEFVPQIPYVKAPTVETFPKEYSWLAKNSAKDDVIVELPAYNWYMPYYSEIPREYYSTLDFRKRINGYSGYTPQSVLKFNSYLWKEFPSPGSIKKLKDNHVKYILIHANEYTFLANKGVKDSGNLIKKGQTIISQLKKSTSVRLIKQIENTYIFAL